MKLDKMNYLLNLKFKISINLSFLFLSVATEKLFIVKTFENFLFSKNFFAFSNPFLFKSLKAKVKCGLYGKIS